MDALLNYYYGIEDLTDVEASPWGSVDEFMNPPVAKEGDLFSKMGRLYLGDIKGAPQFNKSGAQLFSLENIVVVCNPRTFANPSTNPGPSQLTDGRCASTCAIVVEALASIGVPTVVTGGKPVEKEPKLMQHVGGTKG